jgi:hypothetical protein
VQEPLEHGPTAHQHAISARTRHAEATDGQDVALDDGRSSACRRGYRSFRR